MAKIWRVHAFILALNLITKATANAHAIGEVHSDLVVTKYGPDDDPYDVNKTQDEEDPGWMVMASVPFLLDFLISPVVFAEENADEVRKGGESRGKRNGDARDEDNQFRGQVL